MAIRGLWGNTRYSVAKGRPIYLPNYRGDYNGKNDAPVGTVPDATSAPPEFVEQPARTVQNLRETVPNRAFGAQGARERKAQTGCCRESFTVLLRRTLAPR